MASPQAVQFLESVYRRTDKQVRDILDASEGLTEVDTINLLVGTGTSVITPGIVGCVRVDFRSRITGIFLQEYDGLDAGTGRLDFMVAQAGLTPNFESIVHPETPAMWSAPTRYYENTTMKKWKLDLQRGDLLRFHVLLMTVYRRVLITVRIRRLEP